MSGRRTLRRSTTRAARTPTCTSWCSTPATCCRACAPRHAQDVSPCKCPALPLAGPAAPRCPPRHTSQVSRERGRTKGQALSQPRSGARARATAPSGARARRGGPAAQPSARERRRPAGTCCARWARASSAPRRRAPRTSCATWSRCARACSTPRAASFCAPTSARRAPPRGGPRLQPTQHAWAPAHPTPVRHGGEYERDLSVQHRSRACYSARPGSCAPQRLPYSTLGWDSVEGGPVPGAPAAKAGRSSQLRS